MAISNGNTFHKNNNTKFIKHHNAVRRLQRCWATCFKYSVETM